MNIDKDIKDLNKYISFSKKSENFSHNTDYEWHKELGEKIENILKALEGKDCVIETQAHNEEVYEELVEKLEKELENKDKQIALEIKGRDILVNLNDNLKSELETYKKIEEKINQKRHYCLEIPEEHCRKYPTSECGKCIIDWARKEVEKCS